MPIYKTITIDEHSRLLLWNIEESLEELYNGINLSQASLDRLDNMKSLVHKKGYLAVRHLLRKEGLSDMDLYYEDSGKPLLNNGKCITISHSHNFAAILVSNVCMGLDIEKQQDKILQIANKFTPIHEYRTLANDDAIIRKLTLVWAAKEAIYKCYSTKGVSFLNDIDVHDFDLGSPNTRATLQFNGQKHVYEVHFIEFEEFAGSYVFPFLGNPS